MVTSGADVESSIEERSPADISGGPSSSSSDSWWGLAWGIGALAWMRFVSTDPEFTWPETLFIVIGFGIAGLGQSGAFLGRRANLPRPRMAILRILGFASLLPLGMAAGAPMFPAVVLAPLAITHTDWSRRTRWLVGAVATIPVVATVGILLDDLSIDRAVAGSL